jgi:hypothetical protein
MDLPFSAAAIFEVFARYNLALWPAVMTLWLAAAAVLARIVVRPVRVHADRAAALLLVVLWLWAGVAYHAMYFTAINPAAWAFAAFSVVEAGLLAWFGLVGDRLTFGSASPRARGLGAALALYALVYPGLNLASGHPYPATPTFGVPCPTTVFTAGLLLTCQRPPLAVTVVPVCWSLVAGAAALSLGVPADLMLPVAALLLTGHLVSGRGRGRAPAPRRHPADPHPQLRGGTP